MISVPYFSQGKTYTCGPAVLQMVLASLGKEMTEAELADLLNTNEKDGTKHGAMVKVAKDLGFDVFVNEESTIGELRSFIKKGQPIIINFIEPDDNVGHYAIVIGFKDDKIVLNDPWNGEAFEMEINDFQNRWHESNFVTRQWLLVVSLNPQDL